MSYTYTHERAAHTRMSIKEATVASSTKSECCMCGDYGLVEELLRCSVCLFRSQHRYCSNLYPKAGTDRICNWCLRQQEDQKMETPRSSSASSSYSNEDKRNHHRMNKKKSDCKDHAHTSTSDKCNLMLNISSPIKKQIRSLEDESSVQRKAFSRMSKHMFRGKVKVKRYKLLEEVCR